MIEKVVINNFRALRDVAVLLRPLTVLLGQNDTGKSAFLASLQQLVNQTGFQLWDHWRHEPGVITIRVRHPRGDCQLTVPGVGPGGDALAPLQPLQLFHLLSRGVPMESGGRDDSKGPPPIESNGEGVPTLLDYLLRRDRNRFQAVVEMSRQLIPGLRDVEIVTPHPAHRRLDLVIEGGLRVPADSTSAGVRLLLVYVALAYHPARPKIILLEEPENGLHPKRLADVMGLLREITEGKRDGQASQVILTTHSPYLLDLVDLKRDQVLIFQRNGDGSCRVDPADQERLGAFLEEFLLGEVWYNQGEEGLVARQP